MAEPIIPFNTLIDFCALNNVLEPEVSFQKITLAANETVTVTISIKPNYYSVEEELYLYSENPDVIQYSIEIDNQVIIPNTIMLPTNGNTERVILRKGRLKKIQVKITLTNLDLYNSTKVSFKSWIDYISKANYEIIVKPIVDIIWKQINLIGS